MDRRVGYVYDAKMERHATTEEHPECPERHAVIVDTMRSEGLEARCIRLDARRCTEAEIASQHSPGYVALLKTSRSASERVCAKLERRFQHDVYVNGWTYECAEIAAGCALEATFAVARGRVDHALAVIRPPGHHACAHKAMGFCFFNSVAMCARLVKRRVLIVDWDVHHGNGTQDMFYDDPNVLYFSVHRDFYPGTGATTEVGRARGFTVNCRWTEGGAGDAEYLTCWKRLLMPIAKAFDPELILVSAGFDAAAGDPLGQCELTPRAYYEMTRPLADLAPTVICLEGGYNLDIIGLCFAACASALLGDQQDMRDFDYADCQPTAADDILAAVRTQVAYWPVLARHQSDFHDPLVCAMTGISLDDAPPTPSTVHATPPATPSTSRHDEEAPATVGLPETPPTTRATPATPPPPPELK